MRLLPSGHSLWKWWWTIGGVAVVLLLVFGVGRGWSTDLWTAAGVVAVVYVGVPVMAISLNDLMTKRKLTVPTDPPQSGATYLPSSLDAQPAGTGVSAPEALAQPITAEIPSTERVPSRRSGAEVAMDVNHASAAQPTLAADRAPSREML